MRRLVGFAFVAMVAMWLVSFLPPSLSTVAVALVVGVGAAAGSVARGGREVVAAAVGALAGTAVSGLTQGLGSGGPELGEVVNGSATVAVIVLVAGFVSFFVTAVRRPRPPPDRVGDKADR